MAKSGNFLLENDWAAAWNVLPTELRHLTILRLIELSLAENLTSETDLTVLERGIISGEVTSTAALVVARAAQQNRSSRGWHYQDDNLDINDWERS
jgi:aspartate oxidase